MIFFTESTNKRFANITEKFPEESIRLPTQLPILNDYCLLEIFQYLSAIDRIRCERGMIIKIFL